MSTPTRPRTVLLALDRTPQPWAVDTALTLARQLHARLEGLFVEELNLLRLADLPFTREVAALTAQSHPLTTTALEQALRSQARQLQQQLATEAELHQIEWRFTVVRDHLLRAVRSAAAKADLFIMQGTSRYAPPGNTIAALYDGSLEVVDIAAQLAAGKSLHILLASHHDSARQTIEARLRSQAVQPLFVTIADDRVATLRAVIKRHRLSTLVIPVGLLNVNQKLLQPLIDELPCTIVVMAEQSVEREER